MLRASSPRRSIPEHPALVVTTASPERHLRAVNPSPLRMDLTVQESDEVHATTNTHQLGPSTTLQRTTSEVEFNEKIWEAKGPAPSKGQFENSDYLTNNEPRYDIDVRQLIQAVTSALHVLTRAEIQSMTVNEII